MKTPKTLLLLVCLAGLAAGCARINHDERGMNRPISFGSSLGRDYDVVNSFDDSRKKVFFLFSLIPASHFNAYEIAADNMEQSDGVVNLKVTTSYDPMDFLVTVLTAGLVTTWDIDVEGDVVKFRPQPATVNVITPAPRTTIKVQ